MKNTLVFSAEHGVNTVPYAFQKYFLGKEALLQSHRGIDIHSLAIATYLQKELHAPLIQAPTTRLLIDYNRSLHHKQCFSEISKPLSAQEKAILLHQYYLPYRCTVEKTIQLSLQPTIRVWHLSIHSFTPILQGRVRKADIGLLYDPKRKAEKNFCLRLQQELQAIAPDLTIRRNYPYQGKSDGFTTALRKQFAETQYLGIEIECNQQGSLEYFGIVLKKALSILLQHA